MSRRTRIRDVAPLSDLDGILSPRWKEGCVDDSLGCVSSPYASDLIVRTAASPRTPADPPQLPPSPAPLRLARRARGALDRRDVRRERRHVAEIHPARDRRRRRGLQVP